MCKVHKMYILYLYITRQPVNLTIHLSLYCYMHIILYFCLFALPEYSVTQSYANSFWGDVVFDTFNNVSRDKNKILDQKYIKQICTDFIMMIFYFHNIIRKFILTLNYHSNPILWDLSCIESCISLNMHFLQSPSIL